MTDHNAIVVSFADSSNAYQAFSTLKNLAADERIVLVGAHLVTRDQNGRLSIPEGFDTEGDSGLVGGGLIGLLIGILGGPIGMLFGWTAGMLIGGGSDVQRQDRTAGLLTDLSNSIPPGGTAIVAEVEEFTPEVLNEAMGALGGVILRRPAEQVLAELEVTEEAYEQARKEAEKKAKEERKAERKENWDQRVTSLKEKLGIK
ncbi:DUF1269 domain-containing protein [Granulicoccus phenolivorans]|uniref:DUF1269 domain-containing protein n=1 Tax=Granulicoccus phenolivorans TaxID=266854 RepID=UPI0004074878|nr:DUF1269 domain-containing protein [Granulicoccus phenolivorans]